MHHSLLNGGDPYMVLADFRAYSDARRRSTRRIATPRMGEDGDSEYGADGKFSSDRTIREYAEQIWKLPAVNVP